MEPLMGEIKLFPGNFAPEGWYTCEGQTLSISQNTALYSILGTTYGGDGMTTFKLPDLRGAFPTQCTNAGGAHPGGNYQFGEIGGNQNVTPTVVNFPPHTHTILKGAGTNLTGSLAISSSLQASNVPTGATEVPANGNTLSAVEDVGGIGTSPGIYNTTALNTSINGATSVVSNTLNFDPSGLTITPAGGGSAPIATVPNFVAMQYLIAYEGIYPSRP
ncbi:MAG: tail fiber protein [Bacteroidia bacterium]|nr:tail fiber protein [Bacteroidia bacterium]